jgi:hypothetical protein
MRTTTEQGGVHIGTEYLDVTAEAWRPRGLDFWFNF